MSKTSSIILSALLLAVISPRIALGQGAAATTGGSANTPVAAAATTPSTTTSSTEPTRFIIPLNATIDSVAADLQTRGLVKDANAFVLLWNKNKNQKKLLVNPGAYKIPTGSSQTKIALILRRSPYMKWVVIPPGLRKEETAELLARELGWSQSETKKWVSTYTALRYDYREGVFFPDTYLIPVAEKPIDVAKRLTRKFDEKFAEYLPQFTAKNIPWTKGLTMASLIQREAANIDEMPLIAGIMYNRIEQKIPLGIDATIQYIRGKPTTKSTEATQGWWAPLTKADLVLKQSDSKYNTYKQLGMPPAPIGSPGIPAIEAALNPTETDCIYYLHDKSRQIHCTATYPEHLANIEKYLK